MILVTGGAGYIGSHVSSSLQKRGYDYVVVDNLSTGHREAVLCENFELIDLKNKNDLKEIFKKYKIEAIMHFAGSTEVYESIQNPQKYYHNNIISTLNILDLMIQYNVDKIILSSTCATYGNPQYTPIDENHPQHPLQPYGQTKLIIEKILEDYHKAYGLKYIGLRYFNAAGASSDGVIGESHNPETHLIPLVLNHLKTGLAKIKVFGTDYPTRDGSCSRDYIHVEDLSEAHCLALEKINDFNGFINLGTGKDTTVKEVINACEKITNKKCIIEYVDRRFGDAPILYADNKKANNILGWTPKYLDIELIIQSAWNWELNRKF